MKKTLSFLLLSLLLFSLGACSSSPSVGIDSSALEPFVIGGIGPLTEDRAEYGLSVYRGAQIAVEEINATGGVNGFRLVLNFQDSKGDPETAVTLYDKLIDNDMKVLLGGVFSDETEALVPVAVKDGLLVLTPTASRSGALGTEGNIFRVCFSDARLGTMAANFIADNHLTDRVSVIWSNDVFGGNEQVQAFVTTFTGRGGFADLYEIPTEGPADFSSILTEFAATQPTMIYLATSPEDSRIFLQEYGWSGPSSPVKIIGSSGLEGIVESSKVPAELDGMYVATSFAADDPSALVQNFVSTYTEDHSSSPDRYAADAYDGVYAIAEALKKAGITPDNVDDDDFNEKMISAMTKITVNGVTGSMSWTTDGETTRPASVKVIQKGKYAPYAKEEQGT